MTEGLKERITREQVRITMEQLPAMQGASLAVALVLCLLASDAAPLRNILLWLGLLLMSVIGKGALYNRFEKVRETAFDGRRWGNAYVVLTLFAGTAWGLSAFMILPSGNFEKACLFLLIIGGLASGTSRGHSSIKLAPMASAMPGALGYAVRLAMEGTPFGYTAAFLIVIFVLAVIGHSLKDYRFFTSFVALRIEKQDLLEEKQAINDSLRREIAERGFRERRLRRAEMTARFGYWEIFPEAGKVQASEGARTIYGIEKEELTLPEIQRISLPEYRGMLDNAFEMLIEEGRPYNVEFKIRRPTDGKIIDIHSIAEYSPEKGLVFGVLQDITERKRAEEEVREANAYLENIFDNSPDAIGIVDSRGRFLRWNKMAEELYGYTFEEVKLKSCFDLYADQDERDKMLATLRRKGSVKNLEMRMYKKDGSSAPLEISIGLLQDAKGKTLASVCVARDLSLLRETLNALRVSNDRLHREMAERKRAEEELVRLATAMEQTAESIFIADPDWIIRYVNPAFERLTGYNHGEIVGRHTRTLRHDETLYREVGETLARGEVWSGRISNKKKDGAYYEAVATASPVKDNSGAIINYVIIHRDITREVKLEAELNQARKMEAIGLLAGGIAHDFNNILAAIMGFTELSLFKVPQESPVRGNLEQVLKASKRASEVVKQILTFTRQGMQQRKHVGIAGIVQDSIKLLRSSLPSTIEIRHEIKLKPGEDVVLGDPVQLHQVMMNLGTNAGHAMRAKGGVLSVKLSAIADASQLPSHADIETGRHVCITMSDTGHGMDPAVVERIFDPYFTTKGPGEGTGLGLSVVQGIVKSHGGVITVESKPGHGTSFSVYLRQIEGAQPESVKVASESPPAGGERILLVDDEEALVDLGKATLESLGYQVTAMTSSAEALRIFSAQPDAFDLVMTDMTMPSLTGKELAAGIVALRRDIPVILATGFPDLIDEQQAREAGIREMIIKPFEIRTLAVAVRRALEKGS
jgi:PAS domain S-box-containing protein